jgi:hypothetical protein
VGWKTLDLNALLNEKEWRKCRGPENATLEQQLEAFTYFCENYWYIKHPEKGRIKFQMRAAQIETMRSWMSERYTIVLKARQIGFSTLAAAYAFWLVFFASDRYIIMLSRTEREAAKLLAKSKYGYRFLPVWMKERGPSQVTDHQLKMVFNNESSVESLPSGSDPARGESVYLVIVDEWAFLPNPEEAWASIEPITDVGGRVIGLSTANGSGNFYHQLWVGSQTGANKFKGIFFPWDADGERDEDWYTAKSANMQPWQMHQEYPRFPEEAFIKSGNPVFNIDMLDEMPTIEPERGFYHLFSDGNGEFRHAEDGELSVWQFPESEGIYVMAADVAEGLSHGDYSSAHMIDARNGIIVAHWHGHIEPDTFGELLAELGWWYNTALVGIENNNHGLTTLKAAQKHGYKNLYKQRRLAHVRPEQTDILGWRTTASTKPLAIDELAGALRDGSLEVYCARTIAELRTYVRKENGKMGGSPHDDRVMSLAIANQMLKYVWLPEYRADLSAPKNSLLWWEQHMFDPYGDNRVPIGAHNVRKRTPF